MPKTEIESWLNLLRVGAFSDDNTNIRLMMYLNLRGDFWMSKLANLGSDYSRVDILEEIDNSGKKWLANGLLRDHKIICNLAIPRIRWLLITDFGIRTYRLDWEAKMKRQRDREWDYWFSGEPINFIDDGFTFGVDMASIPT